ncbi:AMP-binding protein, partial [Nonomuraea sp. LPB2021202275-12-8]|uniref:AMP-binding protein n=1 Tax=Nonomuraea sp. LPB2021202275-12-8 TaxID=3120159 RepID=UPI00300D6A02
TAVVNEGRSFTFAEVNERANQLARVLIGRGAGPESLVALAVPRSAEMVVALLAVLKAGAAYVPIDTDYPAERVEFMLADAAPQLVITVAGHRSRLPATVPQLVLDDPGTIAELAGLPAG